MGPRKPKIEAAAYHRNGGSSPGFNVAIIQDPKRGRMLVIDFGDEADPDSELSRAFATLNLDEAARGNIYMHPQISATGADIEGTGGNTFDGRIVSETYRPMVSSAVREQQDEFLARSEKRNQQ